MQTEIVFEPDTRDVLDPRLIDLNIIQSYVALARKEQVEESERYFEEALRLKRGAPVASSQTKTAHSNPLEASERTREPSGASAASVLPTPKWSSVPNVDSVGTAFGIARHCMVAFLETYKELERQRHLMAELSSTLQLYPRDVKLSLAAAVSPKSPKEILEEMFESSSNAVEHIRAASLRTSSVLNSQVNAKGAVDTMQSILRLMKEEGLQSLNEYKTTEERANEAMAGLGIRRLASADEAFMKKIPKGGPGILSWQTSVRPPTPPERPKMFAAPLTVVVQSSDESQAASASRSLSVSRDKKSLAKSIAAERLQEHTRQLCEALQLEPHNPMTAAETRSPRREVLPSPRQIVTPRFGASASGRPNTASTSSRKPEWDSIGIEGRQLQQSARK